MGLEWLIPVASFLHVALGALLGRGHERKKSNGGRSVLLERLSEEFEERMGEILNQVPGVRITGRRRSLEENRALPNAKEFSQHLFGLAWDLGGDGTELERVADLARAQGFVPVFEPTHLHVQRFPAGFLQQCGVRLPKS